MELAYKSSLQRCALSVHVGYCARLRSRIGHMGTDEDETARTNDRSGRMSSSPAAEAIRRLFIWTKLKLDINTMTEI